MPPPTPEQVTHSYARLAAESAGSRGLPSEAMDQLSARLQERQRELLSVRLPCDRRSQSLCQEALEAESRATRSLAQRITRLQSQLDRARLGDPVRHARDSERLKRLILTLRAEQRQSQECSRQVDTLKQFLVEKQATLADSARTLQRCRQQVENNQALTQKLKDLEVQLHETEAQRLHLAASLREAQDDREKLALREELRRCTQLQAKLKDGLVKSRDLLERHEKRTLELERDVEALKRTLKLEVDQQLKLDQTVAQYAQAEERIQKLEAQLAEEQKDKQALSDRWQLDQKVTQERNQRVKRVIEGLQEERKKLQLQVQQGPLAQAQAMKELQQEVHALRKGVKTGANLGALTRLRVEAEDSADAHAQEVYKHRSRMLEDLQGELKQLHRQHGLGQGLPAAALDRLQEKTRAYESSERELALKMLDQRARATQAAEAQRRVKYQLAHASHVGLHSSTKDLIRALKAPHADARDLENTQLAWQKHLKRHLSLSEDHRQELLRNLQRSRRETEYAGRQARLANSVQDYMLPLVRETGVRSLTPAGRTVFQKAAKIKNFTDRGVQRALARTSQAQKNLKYQDRKMQEVEDRLTSVSQSLQTMKQSNTPEARASVAADIAQGTQSALKVPVAEEPKEEKEKAQAEEGEKQAAPAEQQPSEEKAGEKQAAPAEQQPSEEKAGEEKAAPAEQQPSEEKADAPSQPATTDQPEKSSAQEAEAPPPQFNSVQEAITVRLREGDPVILLSYSLVANGDRLRSYMADGLQKGINGYKAVLSRKRNEFAPSVRLRYQVYWWDNRGDKTTRRLVNLCAEPAGEALPSQLMEGCQLGSCLADAWRELPAAEDGIAVLADLITHLQNVGQDPKAIFHSTSQFVFRLQASRTDEDEPRWLRGQYYLSLLHLNFLDSEVDDQSPQASSGVEGQRQLAIWSYQWHQFMQPVLRAPNYHLDIVHWDDPDLQDDRLRKRYRAYMRDAATWLRGLLQRGSLG